MVMYLGLNSDISLPRFADPAVFRSTCADLFARMIDTVPAGVTLTDVVEPLDVKPVGFQLDWAGSGNLLFRGEVRVSSSHYPVCAMSFMTLA